ncbi:hypothetical protein [Streptomyces sp. NPDC049590]|uniref:PspA/IM30 family protein n=1 Tax=Streptomyces sp. NPDC049590 TaxID=3154834 RepID=UPI00343DF046
MSETPMTPEQRAKIAELIGDAKPATSALLLTFGGSVRDRREHDHGTQREDWYCLNLSAYMGERVAPVLRRLLDAEAENDQLRAQLAGEELAYERLRVALESAKRGRREARARVTELLMERHSTNESLSKATEALRDNRDRIAALEAEPLAWAEKLAPKSLDNFLIALGSATEHEPMDGAITEIHKLIGSYRAAARVDAAVDRLTRFLAPTQALREEEPAVAASLTVYRASHDSIVMGLYTTREAAREHCEALMRRENPVATLEWRPDGEWREDDDGEPGPDEAEELYVYGSDEDSTWDPSGYVVTPLEVASEYDEGADE